jgi:hypothetical protein
MESVGVDGTNVAVDIAIGAGVPADVQAAKRNEEQIKHKTFLLIHHSFTISIFVLSHSATSA